MNVNHTVSTSGCWIYNSNDKRVLNFMKDSLDIICSTYDVDEMYDEFEMLYYAGRYVNSNQSSSLQNGFRIIILRV